MITIIISLAFISTSLYFILTKVSYIDLVTEADIKQRFDTQDGIAETFNSMAKRAEKVVLEKEELNKESEYIKSRNKSKGYTIHIK